MTRDEAIALARERFGRKNGFAYRGDIAEWAIDAIQAAAALSAPTPQAETGPASAWLNEAGALVAGPMFKGAILLADSSEARPGWIPLYLRSAESLAALSPQPAPTGDAGVRQALAELPPLPAPFSMAFHQCPVFHADQMRAYARAALAQSPAPEAK